MSEQAKAKLEAAHAAYGRFEWGDAYRLYQAAEEQGAALECEDVERLAYSAVLDGTLPIEDMERCFKAYEEAGRPHDAARIATDIARMYGGRLDFASSMGWTRRAERLLEDQPEGPGQAREKTHDGIVPPNRVDCEPRTREKKQLVRHFGEWIAGEVQLTEVHCQQPSSDETNPRRLAPAAT